MGESVWSRSLGWTRRPSRKPDTIGNDNLALRPIRSYFDLSSSWKDINGIDCCEEWNHVVWIQLNPRTDFNLHHVTLAQWEVLPLVWSISYEILQASLTGRILLFPWRHRRFVLCKYRGNGRENTLGVNDGAWRAFDKHWGTLYCGPVHLKGVRRKRQGGIREKHDWK